MPYTLEEQVTALNQLNGVPLYIYLNAFFASIIQLFIGYPFYVSAIKSLRHKSANMDVLIMMGTTAAWGYGIVMIGVGYSEMETMDDDYYHMKVLEHAHNFEISSALITIILLGKYIETLSKKKTVDQLA
jgi:P-type Cu+ transporter